tara:strand:- start:13040 stop:13225 length:186 start_codon:yes stop_codon:yes gene_type:complete
MKSTMDMYGNQVRKFANGSTITFFNGKWIIQSETGIAMPVKFETEEKATEYLKQIYPKLRN